MDVVILRMWPALSRKFVHWRQTCGWIRHMVVNEDCMVDRHGPQRKVGLFRPVNGKMDEHSTGGGLNVLYSFLHDSISMMLPNASILLSLSKFFQMFLVVTTGEDCCIVTAVLLRYNPKITTVSFKRFLCSQSLMRIQ